MNKELLANAIEMMKNESCHGIRLRLPIDEIDGIQGVDICLVKYINTICLEIDGTFKMNYNGDVCLFKRGISLDFKSIDISDFVLNKLSTLKLRADGNLAPISSACKIEDAIDNAFEGYECDNIKINIKKCCVCNERTTTETSCGHLLCHRCWSRLKRNPKNPEDIEEDEYGDDIGSTITIDCPMCRKDIYYSEKN